MKKTILIYDDDEEILLLCKIILSRYDYIIETFTTCYNKLTDLETLKPDVILMDLWIPEMGGEKAITLAKQNERTKHVPILIFSANPDINNISLKINANGYLEKPFSVEDFIKIIQTHTQ